MGLTKRALGTAFAERVSDLRGRVLTDRDDAPMDIRMQQHSTIAFAALTDRRDVTDQPRFPANPPE